MPRMSSFVDKRKRVFEQSRPDVIAICRGIVSGSASGFIQTTVPESKVRIT